MRKSIKDAQKTQPYRLGFQASAYILFGSSVLLLCHQQILKHAGSHTVVMLLLISAQLLSTIVSFLLLNVVFPKQQLNAFPKIIYPWWVLGGYIINTIITALLMYKSIQLGSDPYICAFLIYASGALTAGFQKLEIAAYALLSTLLFGSILWGHVDFSFLAALLICMMFLMLSCRSAIFEFVLKSYYDLKLAELKAMQSLIKDRTEHKTRAAVAQEIHKELNKLTVEICQELRNYTNNIKPIPPILSDTLKLAVQLQKTVLMKLEEGNNSRFDLKAALTVLAGNIKQLEIDLSIVGFNGLCSAEIGEAIFRACQESITNSMKHSTSTKVSLCVSRQPEHYHVSIKDNGGTQGTIELGQGLKGIFDRVKNLRGECNITTSGTEFRTDLVIPA